MKVLKKKIKAFFSRKEKETPAENQLGPVSRGAPDSSSSAKKDTEDKKEDNKPVCSFVTYQVAPTLVSIVSKT